MLLQNPQLAYALLQAQIVMKIVDPQVAMVRRIAVHAQLKKWYHVSLLSIHSITCNLTKLKNAFQILFHFYVFLWFFEVSEKYRDETKNVNEEDGKLEIC